MKGEKTVTLADVFARLSRFARDRQISRRAVAAIRRELWPDPVLAEALKHTPKLFFTLGPEHGEVVLGIGACDYVFEPWTGDLLYSGTAWCAFPPVRGRRLRQGAGLGRMPMPGQSVQAPAQPGRGPRARLAGSGNHAPGPEYGRKWPGLAGRGRT